MKGIIEVVTKEEFDAWMSKQKPNYYTAFPEKDPTATPTVTPSKIDSSTTPGTARLRLGAGSKGMESKLK
jgi:cytochrome c oxidase subunit 2